MLDVIFISYRESNAEENWRHLLARCPQAKRVAGVTGIARAHEKAAEISGTEFFFTVDGDNFILPEFKFSLPLNVLDSGSVYVWRAKNPVNDLVYGFGGVKIYSRSLLRGKTSLVSEADLATTVARRYVVIEELASETRFNVTPLEAWRGAFREVTKLAVNCAMNAGDERTRERLETWMTKGKDRLNGEWVLKGAEAGDQFSREVLAGREKISRINDFVWLEEKFNTP